MGYLGYYFAWLAFSYLIREPRLLVGLLVLWLLRRLLPPPGAIFGALGRAGRLREQVRVNRANITARRDLATIYLSLLRPRRALPLLEEGLALAPEDAELSYLYGVALHRAGRHDEALTRLLAAIERDGRLRHGQPYFVAGETLLALRRWDDAADAFERYLDFNSSDVAAHTFLARAHADGKDAAAARKWLLAGLTTWHGLAGALKRRQFGAYLRAQWARITVLHDTSALLVALLILAVLVGGVRAVYPLAVGLWQPNDGTAQLERLQQASRLCGSQQTGDFAGTYDVQSEPSDDTGAERYAGFSIEKDRIVSGRQVVQEFCLTRVFERSKQSLHAEAVLRFRSGQAAPQGQGSPAGEGDNSDVMSGEALGLYDIRLDRGAEATRFRFAPVEQPLAATLLTLRRQQ